MFSNDQSTMSFQDNRLSGRMYTWGLNNDGQLGSVFLAHKPEEDKIHAFSSKME